MAATVQDIAEFLAKVPLFQGLTQTQLDKLAKNFRERDYAPEEIIIEQGKVGVGLFILVRGEAKVVRHQPDGDNFELDRLHRTDFFGEMSLLDDAPRAASVIATEQTKCLALNKLDFIDTLHEDAEMAVAMLKAMAFRYRRLMASL
jgi:CRP/FNR family transcriptional regulator/CRP/FNR family cyclic AMP-dependent transcriptional regulator